MKKLVALMMMTTTAAFACPNLTGQYLCNDEYNGEYIETITQTGQGAKTIYTSSNDIDGETLVVADGKWKNFSQAGVTINFKATCVGKVLNVETNLNDPTMGKIESLMMTQLDGNNDLKHYIATKTAGQVYTEEVVCTRL